TTPSQPCPTARDPCKQCQASDAPQRTADKSTPLSQNNAPRSRSYLSRPHPKRLRLYQTLSAQRAARSHRCCPSPSSSLIRLRLAQAEAARVRSTSSSYRHSAAHRDNRTVSRALNTSPAAD